LEELLAEACLQQNRDNAALGVLRKLIDGGSFNPNVYATAARVAFRKQVPALNLQSRLDEGASEIRSWCTKAIEIEPLHIEANNILAWVEALEPRPGPVNLAAIRGAYQRLTGQASTSETIAALALAMWRYGDVSSARALCEKLVASRYTDDRSLQIANALMIATENVPPVKVP
jgi:hypothetical protein